MPCGFGFLPSGEVRWGSIIPVIEKAVQILHSLKTLVFLPVSGLSSHCFCNFCRCWSFLQQRNYKLISTFQRTFFIPVNPSIRSVPIFIGINQGSDNLIPGRAKPGAKRELKFEPFNSIFAARFYLCRKKFRFLFCALVFVQPFLYPNTSSRK